MMGTVKVYFALNEATFAKTLGNVRMGRTNHVVRGVGTLRPTHPPPDPPPFWERRGAGD